MDQAEQEAKSNLANVWFLVQYEDFSICSIPALSHGIQLSHVDREFLNAGDTIQVKLSEVHPETLSPLWDAHISAIGHKSYCQQCAKELTGTLGDTAGGQFVHFKDDPTLKRKRRQSEALSAEKPQKSCRKQLLIDNESNTAQIAQSLPILDGDEVLDFLGDNEDDDNEGALTVDESPFDPNKTVQRSHLDLSEGEILSQESNRSSSKQVSMILSSSTPAPKKKKKSAKTVTADEVEKLMTQKAFLNLVESQTQVNYALKDSVDSLNNAIQELKINVSFLANRNYQEVQTFGKTVKAINVEVAKLGVLLPKKTIVKTPGRENEPQEMKIPITKGENIGQDLYYTEGSSNSNLWRNVARRLYTKDQLKNIMLSPLPRPPTDPKRKSAGPAKRYRNDWSPVRKNLYKGKLVYMVRIDLA